MRHNGWLKNNHIMVEYLKQMVLISQVINDVKSTLVLTINKEFD